MRVLTLIFGLISMILFLVYSIKEPTPSTTQDQIFWGIMYVIFHMEWKENNNNNKN